MSEVSKPEGFHYDVFASSNAHVFCCPYCREHTTVISPLSFISRDISQCENCSHDFLIENDVAHVLTSQ